MTNKVICYFQETEPNSSAVAIRAKYFIESIKADLAPKVRKLQIITATEVGGASECSDVEYIRFSAGNTDEGASPVKRIFAEILFGFKSSLWFLLNHRDSILVISSPNYLPAIFLAASAKILKVKYVLDIRDAYPEAYAQSGLISTSSVIYKMFLIASKAMYKYASAVTTATDGLKSIIPISVCNVTTIYNGFPSSLISYAAAKHKKFTVCFHGVMGYFQDIEKLVELIKHPDMHDIDFVVIGYGRKADFFRSLDAKNCRFLGRLSHNETMQQISICHLGISMRSNNIISRDSFPVKVWEYMGLAIPSLVYPRSEAGDFLESNNCGIQLPSNNVDDISNIIISIKSNQSMYDEMVKSCCLIRNSYTRESISRDFTKILDNILRGS